MQNERTGMEPLDLSAAPPRPPHETIAGVMFLPRTVDKVRAELPGGRLNGYLIDYDRGLSSYVLYKCGISLNDLRAAVASASSDADVTAWLESCIDPAKAGAINAKLTGLRVDAMDPDDRELMYERHPHVPRGAHEYVLEVIEAEDAAVARASATRSPGAATAQPRRV